MRIPQVFFLGFAALGLLFAARAGGVSTEMIREGTVERARCADRDPLRRALFGDLHVHTALSLDANAMGTRVRPSDAYAFARGREIGIQPHGADGKALRTIALERPLDFVAVTDHAEFLGEMVICETPDAGGYESAVCRAYRAQRENRSKILGRRVPGRRWHRFCGAGHRLCREAAATAWRENRDATEAAYDRSEACRFTSFHGYEWTGGAGRGNNFHRNVIFANDVVPEVPISFRDESKLMDFWLRLGRECSDAGEGCDVLVIPHNPNLSGGRMFRTRVSSGAPIPVAEAERRARYERLVEVMQHKGDSECRFGLQTEDELCNFEKLPANNFRGLSIPWLAEPPVARQFVRNVLKEGLVEDARLGVNPFRFGMIASTDTHIGAPGLVDEAGDRPGHHYRKEAAAVRPQMFASQDRIEFNPGGLAGVWAEENSRRAIFAALKRREAFGTSGPRIRVRFFGGWGFTSDLCNASDLVARGYRDGVPMGGELKPPPTSEASPTFVVSALKDPGVGGRSGTPLQRVQIIKGWLEDGVGHERVIEVAGDPRNGAGVDTDTCTPHGSGYDALCGVWRDPDFDPNEHAFYYARVVENPTCRWSQKLCASRGVRCGDPDSIPPGFAPCCDESHRTTIQERAWTSPIWFRPVDSRGAPDVM